MTARSILPEDPDDGQEDGVVTSNQDPGLLDSNRDDGIPSVCAQAAGKAFKGQPQTVATADSQSNVSHAGLTLHERAALQLAVREHAGVARWRIEERAAELRAQLSSAVSVRMEELEPIVDEAESAARDIQQAAYAEMDVIFERLGVQDIIEGALYPPCPERRSRRLLELGREKIEADADAARLAINLAEDKASVAIVQSCASVRAGRELVAAIPTPDELMAPVSIAGLESELLRK